MRTHELIRTPSPPPRTCKPAGHQVYGRIAIFQRPGRTRREQTSRPALTIRFGPSLLDAPIPCSDKAKHPVKKESFVDLRGRNCGAVQFKSLPIFLWWPKTSAASFKAKHAETPETAPYNTVPAPELCCRTAAAPPRLECCTELIAILCHVMYHTPYPRSQEASLACTSLILWLGGAAPMQAAPESSTNTFIIGFGLRRDREWRSW